MISRLVVENFKSIGDRIEVDLHPITLLFGPNGAGKSSILQSLFYLREVLETNNADVGVTSICGQNLDFGGFSNVVHRHDLRRTLKISVTFPWGLQDSDGRGAWTGWSNTDCLDGTSALCTLAIEISARAPERVFEADVVVSFDGDLLVRLAMSQGLSQSTEVKEFNCHHPLLRKAYGREDGTFGDKLLVSMCRALEAEVIRPGTVRFVLPHAWAVKKQPSFCNDDFSVTVTDYNNFEVASLLGSFFTTAVLQALENLLPMLAVGPLRTNPHASALAGTRKPIEAARWYTGEGAWQYLLHDANDEFIQQVSRALTDGSQLDMGLKLRRDTVSYVQTRTTSSQPCYTLAERIKDAASLDAEHLREHLGDMLKLIEASPREVRLILQDQRTSVDIAPHAVGVGASQVIPVVVAVMHPATFVVLEQPELHLHPAAQVVLGDLLVGAIQARGKQLLVETHSEHILLRLLKRIRQTSRNELPEQMKALRTDQLAVNYVEPFDGEPGARSTRVKRLRVDEQGEFLDVWPRGFFDERSHELFE